MSEKKAVYIVAVSGGVDSVVLLDALANNRLSGLTSYQLPTTNYQLVVAHVDHGIRKDSGDDARFVEQLAKRYDLAIEKFEANLGEATSENEARKVRYNFLRQCCKKHETSGIITAHHQDDVLETIILNLLRGTGWRGLVSMSQTSNSKSQIANEDSVIFRPLLNVTKAELSAYAQKYDLQWREDSTNMNQSYLRNYVRHTLLPKASEGDNDFNKKMLKLNAHTQRLRGEIEELTELITAYHLPSATYQLPKPIYQIPRYNLIMWSEIVAKEVLYAILCSLDDNWHPDKNQIQRVLHFIKTAQAGKQFEVNKNLVIRTTQREAQFQFTS